MSSTVQLGECSPDALSAKPAPLLGKGRGHPGCRVLPGDEERLAQRERAECLPKKDYKSGGPRKSHCCIPFCSLHH